MILEVIRGEANTDMVPFAQCQKGDDTPVMVKRELGPSGVKSRLSIPR